jgi:hypothetical protein
MQRIPHLTRSRRSGSLLAADIVFLQVGGKSETTVLRGPVAFWLTFSYQRIF